jgi:hypothetical protein
LRAPFAKHVDEVASQSLAAKQLDTPIDARSDKLLVARRIVAMIEGHGKGKYISSRGDLI